MSDNFESELDEQLDLAGEGLRAPDEVDLAQDREDRKAGESPTETAVAEEDLSEEKFIYTFEDGTEIEGTIDEIVAAKAAKEVEAKVAEELAKVKAAAPEKPAEAAKTGEGEPELVPVDWTKTGDLLAERLGIPLEEMAEGERKLLGEIGPMMNDAIHRTILTSPYIGQQLERFVVGVLQKMEQGTKKETAFKEFAGAKAEVQEAEIVAFQKDNPWANTKEMAVLGLQLARQRQEIENLKTGKTKEVKEAETAGKKAGEKETVKSLKAKGQLRRVAGSGKPGGTRTTDTGKPPQNENERVSAWAKAIEAKRQGAAT